MRYIRIKDDGNHDVLPAKPVWFYDDGTIVSDQWFIENEGIYPLYEPNDGDGRYLEKDMPKWVYGTDRVTKTYYIVIDEPPDYDGDIKKKLVLNPSNQWNYDDVYNQVKKTYRIETRTQSEIDDLVLTGKFAPDTRNPEYNYVEKPNNTWQYHNGFIHKKYWQVVKREFTRFEELFYTLEQKPVDDWDRNDVYIYEDYNLHPRDVDDIKQNLIPHVYEFRWNVEIGGFVDSEDNVIYHTDRESQAKMTSKYLMVKNSVITEGFYWKTVGNEFMYLSLEKTEVLFLKIANFIQTLYDIEKSLIEDIRSKTTFEELKTIYDNIDNMFNIEGRVV
jgi:hypothetical protein